MGRGSPLCQLPRPSERGAACWGERGLGRGIRQLTAWTPLTGCVGLTSLSPFGQAGLIGTRDRPGPGAERKELDRVRHTAVCRAGLAPQTPASPPLRPIRKLGFSRRSRPPGPDQLARGSAAPGEHRAPSSDLSLPAS